MKLTKEQENIAITAASEGKTLQQIADSICVGRHALWQYRQDTPDFSNRFDHARQEGVEHLAEDLLNVHEQYADVQRARLKSENTRWYLSKIKPSKYGDRIDVNVNKTVDIGGALKEAMQRAALPMRDVTTSQLDQGIDTTKELVEPESDTESDLEQDPHGFRLGDIFK